MIVIKVDDVFCKVVKGKARKILPALKFKDPRAKFSPQFRSGSWDGYVRFLNLRTKEFPTGLLPQVEKRCKKKNIPYRLLREIRKPVSLEGIEPGMLFGKDLYPEQLEAVKISVSAERGFLWLATNAGKSLVAAAICKHLHENTGGRALILVPNKGLLHQTAQDIRELTGLDVGVVGDGKRSIGAITVATAQTLIKGSKKYVQDATEKAKQRSRRFRRAAKAPVWDEKLWKFLQRVNVLIVDEGHHASAVTWQALLAECPARFRFGMTGTMKDDDDPIKTHTLVSYLGPLLMRIRNSDLIEKGRSAKPYVYLVVDKNVYVTDCVAPTQKIVKRRHPVTGRVQKKKVKLQPHERYKLEMDKLLTDPVYNGGIVDAVKACVAGGLKPLVLTHSIKQLGILNGMLDAEGLTPLSVWGDVPVAQREQHKASFTSDNNAVLLGSTVFDEGQNVPAVGAIILAGGGKSLRRLLQRIGRALRKKLRGLNAVVVLDFTANNGQYVQKHSKKRAKVYKSEGFKITEIRNLRSFCKKARDGWRGLLGLEQYVALLKKQNESFEKRDGGVRANGPTKKQRSTSKRVA